MQKKKKKKIVAQMGAETIFSNVVDRPLKLTCSRESRWVLETTLSFCRICKFVCYVGI